MTRGAPAGTGETIRAFVQDLAASLGRCSITLYTREGDFLVPRAHAGLGTLIERAPVGHGALGRVVQRARAELVADLRAAGEVRPFVAGITSAIVAPVGEGERVVGVLDVQSVEQLTARDRDLLEVAARQVSRTMLRAEQDEANARRAARAEMLLDAGIAFAASLDPEAVAGTILDQMARLVAADGAALLLAEADGRLRLADGRGPFALDATLFDGIAPSDFSLTREMARTLRPFLVSDIPAHFGGAAPAAYGWLGSVIAVPLAAGGRLLGAALLGARAHAAYTPEDAAAAAALARHAAIALRNAQAHAAMAKAAETDPLTGLPNRRALMDRLRREIERAKRYDHLIGLLFFDLDRFKAINDTHGHQFGDRVLRELAQIAGRSVRSIDLVARYGGEEFVAVLPETDGAQALIVAERLRRNVMRHAFILPSGAAVPATISIGVAVYPGSAATLDDLLRAADAALYQAKADGRNRVHAAPLSAHPLVPASRPDSLARPQP